jgi:hypothetical protein
MMTLLLVAALCDSAGCTYMDVSRKFNIATDNECVQMANFANSENRKNRKDPRFACLEPSKYRELVSREL